MERCSHLAMRDRQAQRIHDELKVTRAQLALTQAKLDKLQDELDARDEDTDRIIK